MKKKKTFVCFSSRALRDGSRTTRASRGVTPRDARPRLCFVEKLRSDCGMEHGWDARVAPGVSASVPETGDDEVLPDAPRFVEAPKDSLSSPPAPALFSVEPVPLTRYCPHVTKEACREARGTPRCCEDVHFRRIKHPQTAREPNADCHFLQLCRFSTTTCRFQHWEIDDVLAAAGSRPTAPPLRFCAAAAARVPERLRAIPEPQWICADLSPAGLDLATLGEFGVVMMDPPVRQHPFTSQHSNHRLLGSMTTLPDPHIPSTPSSGPSASMSPTTRSPTRSSAS